MRNVCKLRTPNDSAVYDSKSLKRGVLRACNPERDRIPPRDREDRQTWPGYCIHHNHDDSISFGTEEREYFGFRPKSPVPSANPSSTPSPPWFATRPPKAPKSEAYSFA